MVNENARGRHVVVAVLCLAAAACGADPAAPAEQPASPSNATAAAARKAAEGPVRAAAVAVGGACTMQADCDLGLTCVDGVCCATSCTGGTNDCMACSVAAGGSADGACTPRPMGTACSDGLLCTTGDACGAPSLGVSVCLPTGGVVTCPAIDQCHTAGSCDPATGMCLNPVVANGTPCNDNSLCTSGETCQTGVCTPATTVTCAAPDQCHDAATCNATTGVCDYPLKANGTNCNDSNACTQQDSCQSGVCTGMNPVTCVPSDQCHVAGTCDTSTGVCSNPAKADGTACDDGNMCTVTDVCTAGACAPGAARNCDDSIACTADSCVATSGCVNMMIPACMPDAATPDAMPDAPPDTATPDTVTPDTTTPDTAMPDAPVDAPPDTTGVDRIPDTGGLDRAPDTMIADGGMDRADTAPAGDGGDARDGAIDGARRVGGGGGCDCNVGGQGTGALSLPVVLGLGLLLARRRRRR
jgi:MYXO-CTERM domain-containing protein